MVRDCTIVDCPTCGAEEGDPCVFYGGKGAGEPKKGFCCRRRTLARQAAHGGGDDE